MFFLETECFLGYTWIENCKKSQQKVSGQKELMMLNELLNQAQYLLRRANSQSEEQSMTK